MDIEMKIIHQLKKLVHFLNEQETAYAFIMIRTSY